MPSTSLVCAIVLALGSVAHAQPQAIADPAKQLAVVNARFNLGELFRLEGKYDESVKQFREYLRLAPDAPQNRRNIERAKGYIQKFGDQ